MERNEKLIAISNEALNNISLKLDCLHTAIEKMAQSVSEIELSERDSKLERDYMPRNICANILYLLADYSSTLDKKVEDIIRKAGGDLWNA